MAPEFSFIESGTIVYGAESYRVHGVTVTSEPEVPIIGTRHPRPVRIDRCPVIAGGKHSRGWHPKKQRSRR